MFCTKCGKKITPGQKFCTGCGKKAPGVTGSAIQEKNESRYFWLFRIQKWVGYPVLFFLMFLAIGVDIYYFGTSKTTIAALILAGLLLIILSIILQKYIKAFRYAMMGLLTLSVLAGVALLGLAGYRYLIERPSSLTVTVVKGPVSGASVNIYELDANGGKGNLIAGPLTSDASGSVNFDLPPNLPKRLFIESKGGFYRSEATGQQVSLKDTDVLTAVLPAGTETAAVTPFTHMAAALAQAKIQGGEAPDDAVISANEAVAKQYGLKSIFDTAPVDATDANAAQATLAQKQYGLLLGGFAQLAKNLDVRSIELANALARDWSDGQVDGKEGGNPITVSNGPRLGSAGINGLNDAVNQFAKTEKNYTSLKESSISLNPVLEKIGLRIITTSLPSWISGKQGSFTVTARGGSLPLAWSVKSGSLPEGFTLSKDGIISGTYTLAGGVTKKVFPQFTLEVKDQQGQAQSITLSITVTPEAPQITTYNPPTLTVDESYDEIIATANGGMPPYTFQREASSGPMPMGMQITSGGTSGHLTGSPQAKGNFSFRVCVIDSASTEKCGDVVFAVKETQVAAPADTEGCPSPFDGTWSGTFQETGERWYMDDPATNAAITHSYNFSFTVEFTAKCDWYNRDEGWASLKITQAAISHPFYGCQGGCSGTPLGHFSVEGDGDTWLSIEFPNTTLTIGQLKMSGNNSIGAQNPDVYLTGGIQEEAFYDYERARQGWPACRLSIGCSHPVPFPDYNITFTKK